jgi:predicted amidohydrolase YtcJ
MPSTFRTVALLCGILAAPLPLRAEVPADVIYSGGVIVTVVDAKPTVEAVAVQGGKIVAAGAREAVLKGWRGASTKVVDLKGRTMIPGFVDAHSHFINAVEMANWVNVSAPPVGPVKDIAGLLDEVARFQARMKIKPGGWIVGYGYDGTTLADGRELTRDDLDSRFPDNPVVLTHASMHGAVLNSLAFKAVEIEASTPTPKGGVTLRKPNGEPAGLVMEQSYLPVYLKMPRASEPEMLVLLKPAQEVYASNGYTTVVDAPMDSTSIALYTKGADRGLFTLDLIGYARWLEFPEMIARGTEFTDSYRNHLKWPAGVKIVGDGSPQGKTAYFTRPYLTGGPEGQKDWRGEPNITPDSLNYLVRLAYDHNVQVEYHANGDHAIDMLLRGAFGEADDGDPLAVRPPRPARQVRHVRPDPLVLHQPCLLLGRCSRPEPGRSASLRPQPDEDRPSQGSADLESHRRLRHPRQRPPDDLDRRQPDLAIGQGHRPRRASPAHRRPQGRHHRRRLPVLRGVEQGHDRGRQARRPGHPLRQPPDSRPRQDPRHPGPGDDQGRQDGLPEARGAVSFGG